MFRKKKIILVICFFILLLGLKLGHLAADPPIQLSWSGGVFGDEGAHAHNARNKILFGRWITDDWNPMFYNPFLTLSEYGSFLLFGSGLRQVRLVAVMISFLGLILFYLALQKNDFEVAFGAAFLLGVNYIYLMYSRLGLTDSFMSAVLLIAFFLWQKGLEKPKILFLAGLASFLAYISKGTAVYFLMASVISLMFALSQKGKGAKKEIFASLAYFFSGLMIAFLLWFFFFYQPNHAYFARYGGRWLKTAIPGSWERLAGNLRRPRIFYLAKTPLIFLTSLFYFPFFLYSLFKEWKKVNPSEFFAWLWWGGGIIFFSILNYNPLRYFVSVIPAFCLVTAFALNRLMKGKVFSGNKPGTIFWALYSIWGLAIFKLVYRFFTGRQLISFLIFIAFSTLFVWLGYYLFLTISAIFRKKAEVDLSPIKLFVLAMFLTAALTNGYRYAKWFIHPAYTVINTSREIGRILDKAYIAGLWSPLLCLENSHRALYLGEGNEKEAFPRYPVTHLILWDGNNREELRMLNRNYPEIMKKAEEIEVYRIKDLPVRLFKLSMDG